MLTISELLDPSVETEPQPPPMTILSETDVAGLYFPLSSPTETPDFELPDAVTLNGNVFVIPKRLKTKDVHHVVLESGVCVRAAWIHPALAKLFNACIQTIEKRPNVASSLLRQAAEDVELEISRLVKRDVLKDPVRGGAMSFAQAHENVPLDGIAMTSRTLAVLTRDNPVWRETSEVVAVRYPNLGPETTRVLKLIVTNEPEGLLFSNPHDVIDAFFLHPKTLKESFEGDSDGDTIYIRPLFRGAPQRFPVMVPRLMRPIDDIDYSKLERRANNTIAPLSKWLPQYHDPQELIGVATYAIRYLWHLLTQRYRNQGVQRPASRAWSEISPFAVKRMEMVFDLRKDDGVPFETKCQELQRLIDLSAVIQQRRHEGDVFCSVVTNNGIADVPKFCNEFSTLQEFLDYVIP